MSPSLGGNQNQTQWLTLMSLCLVNAGTAALEAQLRAETNFSPEGCMIIRDYPVQVLPGGIVELRWNGIRPSARKAIQYLSQHIKIVEADFKTVDLTHEENLPPGAEDAKILQLAKSGDVISAVKLTRQIYNCSLAEAKDFVMKLPSRAS